MEEDQVESRLLSAQKQGSASIINTEQTEHVASQTTASTRAENSTTSTKSHTGNEAGSATNMSADGSEKKPHIIPAHVSFRYRVLRYYFTND
jgi:hypothetical protein